MKPTKLKLMAASLTAALLPLALSPLMAQYAIPRVNALPIFIGSGLQAVVTQGTNNVTGAGEPLGGLNAVPVLSTYAPLVNGLPAGLLIRFNQHGFPTNQLFCFSLTVDGTNFSTGNTLPVFTGGKSDAGPGNVGSATNGFLFFTNFSAATLAGAIGIRLERITNSSAISNLTITVSQPYSP